MAGHSKWNNIKNRKGAVDAKKGKVFGQISKLIRIAVKEGGGDDPISNPGLRLALEKARAANMPKVNIDRALSKGMGRGVSGSAVQEIMYEAFGPGGVALLIEAVTDNANRTSSEVKHALSRNHGSLSGPGSAQFLFTKQISDGILCYEPIHTQTLDPNQAATLEQLLDALKELEDVEEIYTTANL
ncbi:MAG: YebC/PmpR family DNA-binding transcriptional regulator [Candidatus Pacebacteria bacterium]|nr:YebC/PmpR family DNA-binding transcriptional regulator [Candidatus Paceibacterota bacterium]PIR60054.1 MAG: YebC/PmpR family DNA-binding transcriptional regulator [Candidatus Pacebacteria bacterium CG10_big_fil_rev_8_21_14_0_10_44_54]